LVARVVLDEGHTAVIEDPWDLTLQLIAAAPDKSALGYIAAGPLDDLLYARGALFIDELGRLARSDPKFLSALQMVAGPFTKESDVSNRIVRAAGVALPFVDEDWPRGTGLWPTADTSPFPFSAEGFSG
jgi:hypothetical protein